MYQNSYTLRDIGGLISSTYILAVVMAILFIGISIVVANLIAYEGGKSPRDPQKRRVWFFVLAAVNTVVFFLWNYLYVVDLAKGAPAQSEFLTHAAISTGVTLVVYVLIGFILSKVMKQSKYGTIFP